MDKYLSTEKFASHPRDFRHYDTQRLREEFLIESLFEYDKVVLTYTGYDRLIVGGALPKSAPIYLEAIPRMKAAYFCERRELGIINLGGNARIMVDGISYQLGLKEALYISQGSEEVVMESLDKDHSSMLYLNSAPAHRPFSNKLIRKEESNRIEAGDADSSNKRIILQYLVPSTCQTCQLQMGITELQPGSVWNTMPPHTHSRRMEVYLYTDLPEDQAVCHFMGTPEETRHIWIKNNQAVVSPNWSIHSAAGTSNYSFIWSMAGENLDFTDMEIIKPSDLK